MDFAHDTVHVDVPSKVAVDGDALKITWIKSALLNTKCSACFVLSDNDCKINRNTGWSFF